MISSSVKKIIFCQIAHDSIYFQKKNLQQSLFAKRHIFLFRRVKLIKIDKSIWIKGAKMVWRFSFENKLYMNWQNKNSLDGWRRNHSNATQCQMRHFCQNILEVKLALEKGCVVKVNFSILYTTIQFIMSYNLKAKIYIFHIFMETNIEANQSY